MTHETTFGLVDQLLQARMKLAFLAVASSRHAAVLSRCTPTRHCKTRTVTRPKRRSMSLARAWTLRPRPLGLVVRFGNRPRGRNAKRTLS